MINVNLSNSVIRHLNFICDLTGNSPDHVISILIDNQYDTLRAIRGSIDELIDRKLKERN